MFNNFEYVFTSNLYLHYFSYYKYFFIKKYYLINIKILKSINFFLKNKKYVIILKIDIKGG